MSILLTPIEARVLGALIEKEATTPEYYPLSLNALVNACNQKNNREPVMQLSEDDVRQALHNLESDGLAGEARADSRVPKYEHRLQEVFNFTRGEAAIVCTLLLRGAQTPGELRGRAERIYRFGEIDDVLAVLQRLMQREPPIVTVLPRQPGSREVRYAHLLSGEVALPAAAPLETDHADLDRLQRLESEVALLRREVAELREQFAALASSNTASE
jgi:hypothetical protein